MLQLQNIEATLLKHVSFAGLLQWGFDDIIKHSKGLGLVGIIIIIISGNSRNLTWAKKSGWIVSKSHILLPTFSNTNFDGFTGRWITSNFCGFSECDGTVVEQSHVLPSLTSLCTSCEDIAIYLQFGSPCDVKTKQSFNPVLLVPPL